MLSGFLFIASKAEPTNIHSQIQTHSQANQIEAQTQIVINQSITSLFNIWNATINQ